jgi:hypothetical protein
MASKKHKKSWKAAIESEQETMRVTRRAERAEALNVELNDQLQRAITDRNDCARGWAEGTWVWSDTDPDDLDSMASGCVVTMTVGQLRRRQEVAKQDPEGRVAQLKRRPNEHTERFLPSNPLTEDRAERAEAQLQRLAELVLRLRVPPELATKSRWVRLDWLSDANWAELLAAAEAARKVGGNDERI